MNDPTIHTIDLNFRQRPGTIAAYLVPHSHGAILVETGPGSTLKNLLTGIKDLGYTPQDVSDVFLTHIHLDHAGAAGWWAQQGALVHVHEHGAPHLINPEKLLSSAGRLYGSMMDELWGQFLPVPEEKISIMHDQDIAKVADVSILALDVPGHANHHLAFIVGDACFSGDIGGIRVNPRKYLTVPMPPPDINLEKWRNSIRHIQHFQPQRIAPTHFGVYDDAPWHLQAVLEELDEVDQWLQEKMAANPSIEELRRQFVEFEAKRAIKYGVEKDVVEAQQIANPSYMSADGLLRYWNKYRVPAKNE